MKYIYTLLAFLISTGAHAQGCGNTLTMPDTMSLCVGVTSVIPTVMTGTDPVTSIAWTPATGLSSVIILNPTITAGTSGYRFLTVKTFVPTNLVVNGDFSAGNTGFSSAYTFTPPPSVILNEGFYSVYTNPNSTHTGFIGMGDHTTGSGNMMILNGGPAPDDVWCQTIAVTPNTDYSFSAWFANCSPPLSGAPVLQFKVNSVLLGAPASVTTAPGIWVNFSATWNSGASTTATICINDNVTTAVGNDFVIDDIVFQKICTFNDSVYIKVNTPDTTTSSTDITVCNAAFPHTLTAPSGYTTYTWSTGATATTTLNATSAGTFWVNSESNCVLISDTFIVTSQPNPIILLGNDTSFCTGNTLILSSVQPTGFTHLWSTGSTLDTIHVSSSGTYSLTVTDTFGCAAGDAISITVSPSPIVDLGPDVLNCNGTPALLQSTLTYPSSATYLWSDLATLTPTYSASATGTYWLQVTMAGCSAADTINVTIKYDTFTLYTNDTAICKGRGVQVSASNNPNMTYQWLPTAGIMLSTVASPYITPDTSAMYVITAQMDGCPIRRDSFFLDVQPIPDVFVGNTLHVCKHDTLRLRAFVLPAWYTHYIYSWSPAVSLNSTTLSSVIFTAGDTGSISVIVTTSAGCIGGDSVMIIVHDLGFSSVSRDTTLCPGDSLMLMASGGLNRIWIPSTYLSSDTASTPWVKPLTSQSYQVIATDEFACRDTVDVTVGVHPAAVVHLDDSASIFPGNSYYIQPSTNATKIIWTPAGGLSNRYISNPVATPAISTRYIIYAATENGCKTKDSIDINIDENTDLLVPNAFAPGSINSKLFPIKKGMVSLNYFRIYNRWGALVYESKDIEQGWDGTYKGTPQPIGVFVYTLEGVSYNGKVFSKTGNITLLR